MIKRYQKIDDLCEAIADIRTDGVIIVEGLFSSSAMDDLLSAVSDELNAQEPGGGDSHAPCCCQRHALDDGPVCRMRPEAEHDHYGLADAGPGDRHC